MKKIIIYLFSLLGFTVHANDSIGFKSISISELQNYLNTEKDYIILDVRTQREFKSGHIPNAVCIPNETIDKNIISKLPNTSQLIFVYCRSGNRSRQAAKKLTALGYTNIIEAGGILDWKGSLQKD